MRNTTATSDITRRDLSAAGINMDHAHREWTGDGSQVWNIVSADGSTLVVFGASQDFDNVGGEGEEDMGWDCEVCELQDEFWDPTQQHHFDTSADLLFHVAALLA